MKENISISYTCKVFLYNSHFKQLVLFQLRIAVTVKVIFIPLPIPCVALISDYSMNRYVLISPMSKYCHTNFMPWYINVLAPIIIYILAPKS